MKLQAGTTYKVSHPYCPNVQTFATCLGEQTHMTVYDTHVEYYKNTQDLERVLNKNGFKVKEIHV